MKYPFVNQDGIKDCGVSCLLMIMKYYGGRASKEYLRLLTSTTKDGVDSYSLLEAAKKLNFSTKGVKGNFDQLEDYDLPCIAHVIINNSYQHFIVIYKIDKKKKKIIIADPATSIKKISFDDFEKISSKCFLLLYPNKKIPILTNKSFVRTFLLNNIYSNSPLFFTFFICALFISILGVVSSYRMQFLLNYIVSYYSFSNLFTFIILFGLVLILREWFNLIREILLNYFNHTFDKKIMSRIYNNFLGLPYIYYKNRSTGEVVSRFQDIENIKNFVGKLLTTCLIDVVVFVITLIVLIKIDLELTIINLVLILIIFIITMLFLKILCPQIKRIKEQNASFNSYLVESITSIETIKGFNLEKYNQNKYSNKLDSYLKTSYRANNTFIIYQFIKNIIEQLGIFIVLILTSLLVIKNKMELGTLITYYTLITYLYDPIHNMFDLIRLYKETKISINRIDELFQIPIDQSIDNKLSKNILGLIKIENLIYQYSPKMQVLNNINLEIKPKDRVLIYGKSGSGKSTLAKLIARVIEDNYQGNITIDNYDISEYSLENYKSNICYISQNEALFESSIYENIYLNSRRDYSDFLDICSICMVDDFALNHPLKYNMLLEENGFNISGGERQRIILARAILKDANIYIFDESLNEIDVDRENKILSTLFKKYPEKTFIIISHRYHNNHLFNRKIKMENGTCYEIT